MSDQEPKTIAKTESVDTAYSRDDWRPGVVSRNTGTGVLNNGDVLFGAYEITGMLGEGALAPNSASPEPSSFLLLVR